MNPYPGDRFTHARQINGSPKAGTARPVEMKVTAVRGSTVYYTRADSNSNKGAWCINVTKFWSIVKQEQPVIGEWDW